MRLRDVISRTVVGAGLMVSLVGAVLGLVALSRHHAWVALSISALPMCAMVCFVLGCCLFDALGRD